MAKERSLCYEAFGSFLCLFEETTWKNFNFIARTIYEVDNTFFILSWGLEDHFSQVEILLHLRQNCNTWVAILIFPRHTRYSRYGYKAVHSGNVEGNCL